MTKKEVASKAKEPADILAGQMASIAKVLDCTFVLKGQAIAIDKVFARLGLLPAIIRRADQLCSFCLGYGLGATFERADGAMLGVTVNFDATVPNSLRLLCVADVVVEILQNAPSLENVAVDDLMAD